MNVARAAQDVDRLNMAFESGILLYCIFLSISPPAMSQSPLLVPIPLLRPLYPAPHAPSQFTTSFTIRATPYLALPSNCSRGERHAQLWAQ